MSRYQRSIQIAFDEISNEIIKAEEEFKNARLEITNEITAGNVSLFLPRDNEIPTIIPPVFIILIGFYID